MKQENKVIAALILGAVVGTAIGAALGILFAPEKGSDTRQKIKDEGKKVMGDLQEKFKAEKEHLDTMKENLVKTVKTKANEFFENV